MQASLGVCAAQLPCTASTSGRQPVTAPRGPATRHTRPNPVVGARRVAAGAAATDAATGQQAAYEPHRPTSTSNYILSNGVIDYYELLGVDDIATPQEIKAAYRALTKVCHVDIAGDNEANRNMCIMLNEAYEILMDPEMRTAYNADLDTALQDEDDGYTGELLSKWMAGTKKGKNTDAAERRGVFVDEVTCIGCKQCIFQAPATFRMEPMYGRSRVFAHWLDKEEDIEAAMLSCPVSCIHWVDKDDLPALEFVSLNKVKRTNVAAMMSQQGGAIDDVWDVTAKYLKQRRQKEEERARAARYSAAVAEQRRAAAEAIMYRQDTWFDRVADKLGVSNMAAAAAAAVQSSVLGSMGASYASDDDLAEYAGYSKVGRRTRARRPAAASYGARGEAGGKVPRERALVPAGAPLRPWRRDVPVGEA